MKIVSWNIQANRGASDERVARLAAALNAQRADVAVLQEVASRSDLPRRLEDALGKIGLQVFVHSVPLETSEVGQAYEKRYGNVIASRWPVKQRPWRSKRWPQLVIAADVTTDAGEIAVVGTHIPNGSGNGWRKVDALETLAAGLGDRGYTHPTILVGDFNEPASFEPDGGVESWRRRHDKTLKGDFTDMHDVTRPRRDWQRAVEAVLGPDARHGLRHAWRERHGAEPAPATHITRGGGARYFDHILVSRHFAVDDAGFDHAVRAGSARTSDHSIASAVLDRAE